MAHTTSRYSGSFETQFESDVSRLSKLTHGDSMGFMTVLDDIITDNFTSDYWTITFPNELATSAAKSPALLAYIAALNIQDANVLLSTSKVRSRLDPAITLKKGIERHHLFPRGHLRKNLGITDTKQVNQIANFALVDWSDNINISDLPPSVYWPEQIAEKQLSGDKLKQSLYWHALADDWTEMGFSDFLGDRRRRMALVVRDAFEMLTDPKYQPVYSEESTTEVDSPPTDLRALIEADLLQPGTTLTSEPSDDSPRAEVLSDGRIYYDGQVLDSLLDLAGVSGTSGSPWSAWSAELPDGRISLALLRDELDS